MIGIGVDILSMPRMAETLDRSGDVFLQRVFSPAEIDMGQKCDHPLSFYATAFAAKEAVFKALTLDWREGVDFQDIQVGRGAVGEPQVWLSGQVECIAAEKGCKRILLSLSFEEEMAIAVAAALDA